MKRNVNQIQNPIGITRRDFIGKAGIATATIAVASGNVLIGKNTSVSAMGSSLSMQQASILSPEIIPDKRVIFRLFAPNAVSVAIRGDYPIGKSQNESENKMIKDSNGVWSVTMGPLHAEFYGCYFHVDGRRTLDPSNIYINRDGVNYLNVVRVPG